jgi:hypothetical protein
MMKGDGFWMDKGNEEGNVKYTVAECVLKTECIMKHLLTTGREEGFTSDYSVSEREDERGNGFPLVFQDDVSCLIKN